MPDGAKDGEGLQTEKMKRSLHELRGGERLKLWMELNLMQTSDPETKVSPSSTWDWIALLLNWTARTGH